MDDWVTFNEPIATYVGHAKGFFAPGLKDEAYARQCIHHLLLCHGEAVRLFRAKGLKNAQIGIVVDVWKHYPARADNAGDIASAQENNEIQGYGMFLHPLFLGGYSEVLTAYMEKNGMTPKTEPGDMETIRQKLDFYGLNFYNGIYDNVDELRKKAETEAAGGNYQERPERHLEAIRDVLHMLVRAPSISRKTAWPRTARSPWRRCWRMRTGSPTPGRYCAISAGPWRTASTCAAITTGP